MVLKCLPQIAAPCGPQKSENLLVREMDQYLDFWNMMAYDFCMLPIIAYIPVVAYIFALLVLGIQSRNIKRTSMVDQSVHLRLLIGTLHKAFLDTKS